jgi:hypothetical protein
MPVYEGKQPYYADREVMNINQGFGVSVSCKQPDVAVAFLNTMLSEEWQKILSWGIEGEDYIIGSGGKFARTEEQRKNARDLVWRSSNKLEALLELLPKHQGTFSDGKLHSGIKDPRFLGRKVMQEFVKAGAPEEILYVSKPHIGTFRLVGMVEQMRHEMEQLGAEIRFQSKVADIEIDNGQVQAVLLESGERIATHHVVLAVGHSARDTFEMLALLLALMMPAHLANNPEPGELSRFRLTWTLIPAAALLMTMLMWVSCGVGFSRFHPVLVTFLFVAVAFGPVMKGRFILHRHRLAAGDIARFVPASDSRIPPDEPWFHWPKPAPADAVRFDSTAAESLSRYTRGRTLEKSAWVSIDGLLHEAMPPMEDLVIGGHPGAIGISSAIAVLVGGLFLVYRGLIAFRVPLVTLLAAYVALCLLPIPVAISESGATWRSMLAPHAVLDPATMLTFVNYELLASPLLFMAFFLATNPSICPMGSRAQLLYALLLGVSAAAAQLYLSCSLGPYVALLAVAQISLWLERRAFRHLPSAKAAQ